MPDNQTRGSAGTSQHHLSAELHVTGRSRFVADEPRPADLHHVKLLTSPFAHARIKAIDVSEAEALPGVAAVLLARDVPGENQIGGAIRDEPLLPESEVFYVGQPIAVVVARTPAIAQAAVKLIRAEYEELESVLSVSRALELSALFAPERRIERGSVAAGFDRADHILEGRLRTGSQEHLYLETQRCRALPTEDREILLQPATQSPGEVQEIASRVLGMDRKDITVDVKRLGGGFGGKERAATIWACLAALACHRTGKPVELRLRRSEDMAWTGKRHPFEITYRIGFTSEGKITAYDAVFNINGGAYADLSMAILERGMLHADNTYYIPNMRIIGRGCRTNVPPNTALRGFGAPQGIFAIEHAIQRIARKLGLDPIEVRRRNAYRDGDTTHFGQTVHEACTPELLDQLAQSARYPQLQEEVAEFNRTHRHRKQGIGVVPVKFGISFTTSFLNQGSALVWVYGDGTVSVSHGGIEMGQGINTKVAQVVASELGVSIEHIRVESNNSKRIGNASPTAASTGADINGNAARLAAQRIVARLRPVAARLLVRADGAIPAPEVLVFRDGWVLDPAAPDRRIGFSALTHQAHLERTNLGAQAFYQTPDIGWDRATGQGRPFSYFVFGCALGIAEIDVLTGAHRLNKVFIVHETGQSLNPALDQGQIEGAFIQGLGWFTMEELLRDGRGSCLTTSLSTYKIPTIRDIPAEFRVEMVNRERAHASVLGSKAIGEPPLIYGEAVWFAIKDAIEAVADHEVEAELATPATTEAVLRAVEDVKARGGVR
jgi:xanthine dehydrogenase large subunit